MTNVPIPIIVGGPDGDEVGTIYIPPNAVPPGSVINIDQPDSDVIDNERVRSVVFDVSVEGFSSFRLSSKARICLDVGPRQRAKDLCLGFFNEQKGEWECEDECTKDENLNNKRAVCGKTDHFTTFALLLSSGNESSGCDDDAAFVTGSADGDGILFACVIALAIMIIVVAIVVSYVPLVRRVIVGSYIYEQRRAIQKVRDMA